MISHFFITSNHVLLDQDILMYTKIIIFNDSLCVLLVYVIYCQPLHQERSFFTNFSNFIQPYLKKDFLCKFSFFNRYSLLHLIHAITCAHASTHATSLMSVKNNTHHFCLWHLLSGALEQRKLKNKTIKFNSWSFFFNLCWPFIVGTPPPPTTPY